MRTYEYLSGILWESEASDATERGAHKSMTRASIGRAASLVATAAVTQCPSPNALHPSHRYHERAKRELILLVSGSTLLFVLAVHPWRHQALTDVSTGAARRRFSPRHHSDDNGVSGTLVPAHRAPNAWPATRALSGPHRCKAPCAWRRSACAIPPPSRARHVPQPRREPGRTIRRSSQAVRARRRGARRRRGTPPHRRRTSNPTGSTPSSKRSSRSKARRRS